MLIYISMQYIYIMFVTFLFRSSVDYMYMYTTPAMLYDKEG